MTVISAKLYKALKSAGVDENLAEEASSEVISFDKKIDKIDNDLNRKYDILNAKFNIMLGLMSASFLMMLAIFVENIIK